MFGRRSRASSPRPRTVVLCLETLEERCTPTAFFFSTGNPDGLMATASRPSSPGKPEIESADDFIAPNIPISASSTQAADTVIDHATFTGLVPANTSLSSSFGLSQFGINFPGDNPHGDIKDVIIEIYAVFPNASNPARTPNVPTRVNSPSDVALESLDANQGQLTFTTQVLNNNFTAANSVVNGIHPSPNQRTGGEGPVSGKEVQFNVTLTQPLDLPAGHYFFVPQVELDNGTFLWLSAPKPIVAPGTPFTPDLQEWIRNDALQPDWLRVGTDIVGGNPAPTFNATFSLTGEEALQPHITSISQTTASPDHPFILTITGTNFTSLSKVVFNADELKPKFISGTELQVQVPADFLKPGKVYSISVTNPSAGHPDIFADNTATLTVSGTGFA